MIPVNQTITASPGHEEFREGNIGNCIQACVASIFELRLDDVPHFLDHFFKYDEIDDPYFEELGFLWHRRARRWARDHYDLDLSHLHAPDTYPVLDTEWKNIHPKYPRYFMGSVQSRVSDGTHCVVLDKDLNIVHDPNPEQDYTDAALKGFYVFCEPWHPGPPDKRWEIYDY